MDNSETQRLNVDGVLLNEIVKKIDGMANQINVLDRNINGDPKNRYDSGMKGDMNLNTRFRRAMVWIVGALIVSILGYGTYVVKKTSDTLVKIQSIELNIKDK